VGWGRGEGGGICYFKCVALGMDLDFMFVALFRILKGLIMALLNSFLPHTHSNFSMVFLIDLKHLLGLLHYSSASFIRNVSVLLCG